MIEIKKVRPMKIIKEVTTITFFLGLTGCASPPVFLSTSDLLESGAIEETIVPAKTLVPIKNMGIWDATQNKRIEKDVWSLSAEQIRQRLTTTETLVAIQKKDASGSLTYIGNTAKISRGSYQVTFDYSNYTPQEIVGATGSITAVGLVGVGLRITADLETTSSGVDIGGLLPIGLGFKNGDIKGRLSFKVFGISNDRVALAVPTTAALDEGSIQRSFEAAATVRTLFSLPDTKLEPYLIGVARVKPSNAPLALDVATAKLTK